MQAIAERLDTMRHNLTLIEATVVTVRRELVEGDRGDTTWATGPELRAAALALIIRSYEDLHAIRDMPHDDRTPSVAAVENSPDQDAGDVDDQEAARALMPAA